MGFRNQIVNILLAIFIFVTFAWEWDGNESTISGFRIYKISKADRTQVGILKDNIAADLREIKVYIPDSEAWQVTYVATAFSDAAESAYSNEVGLPPRTPEQIELIPDTPSGVTLEEQ